MNRRCEEEGALSNQETVNDIRHYCIVRSHGSGNFLVFATKNLARDYVASCDDSRDLYIEYCYDPFMTIDKFMNLPEFQGW